MMPSAAAIPLIDIAPLFGGPSDARDAADEAIMQAAAETGFFVAHGFPDDIPIDALARAEFLRIFELPAAEATSWNAGPSVASRRRSIASSAQRRSAAATS